MKAFDKALRQTVFELVQGGLQGHMANGDTYGVWLVSNQTDTSFPMETWAQRFRMELGAKAATHLKKHGYKGKARIDLAFADAIRIAKHVGDLNIIFVSNGETPVVGTPFDEAVNERFRQLAPEMKRAKATLNTTFVARDGQIIAWAANKPDFLIAMPLVPPKTKATTAEVGASTNAPSMRPASNSASLPTAMASNPAATINSEPPRPRAAFKPIIITKETVAEEKRMYQALTMVGASNDSTRAAAETNSVAQRSNPANTNVAGVSITNVVELKTVAAVAVAIANGMNENPLSGVTNVPVERPAANAFLAQMKLEPTNAVPTVAANEKTVPAEPPGAARQIHPILWAAIGGGTACVFMLAIFFAHRLRRQEPSLISQTIGLERVHSPRI